MRLLIWLAALALPLQALPLPLQPAELFALPLIAASLWRGWRTLAVKPAALDVGALAWTLGVLLAAAVADARGMMPHGSRREVAIALFLFLLYAAIRALPLEARQPALRALVAAAALACALGAAGSVANAIGIETPLAFPADRPYPYLGHAPQARALTPMPNMLASIAMLALVLLTSGAARFASRAASVLGVVLSVGFALTFSKTLLPLALALGSVGVLRRSTRSAVRVLVIATLLVGLLYACVSHVVALPASAERRQLEDEMYVFGPPLFESRLFGRDFVLLPTNYYFNKRSALEAIRRTFPFGLGPGRHPAFTGVLKQEGLYPKQQWAGAPHSTYTGTLAELGLPGAIGLLTFAAAGLRTLRERFANGRRGTPLDVAAAAMTAAVLVEAIATDVMHFRHYVWLVALFANGDSAGQVVLAPSLEGDDADRGREVQRA